METILAPVEPLAEPELVKLETVVREGTGAFMKVGIALMKIRDGKGYKLRGFKTFEQYCEKTFGITDRHGRRLIAATEASQQIEAATGQAPASESVARELVNVAKDPVVLQKVKDRLEKKHTTLGQASAELVKDVVAAVTGKPRPEKPEHGTAAPKPAGKAGPSAATPAVESGDVATLQATFTKARSFLSRHPWFKDDAGAQSLIKELDSSLVLLDKLLANSYAHVLARPGSKPGQRAEAGGQPKCPSCGQPIKAGDPFCSNCGVVLD